MEQVQFIQTTPQQIEDAILKGVQIQIDKLKSEFQPKIPNEYLTRNEVKELLKVDLSTVHNWTKKKKLLAYGIGSRVYYKRCEVEQSIKPLNF